MLKLKLYKHAKRLKHYGMLVFMISSLELQWLSGKAACCRHKVMCGVAKAMS